LVAWLCQEFFRSASPRTSILQFFNSSILPLGSAAWLCQEFFRSASPLGSAKNFNSSIFQFFNFF